MAKWCVVKEYTSVHVHISLKPYKRATVNTYYIWIIHICVYVNVFNSVKISYGPHQQEQQQKQSLKQKDCQ